MNRIAQLSRHVRSPSLSSQSRALHSLEGKVLIANRGEIAIRISRAARELGLKSVAVFAPQDRESPHLSHADEAIELPRETSPIAPYLNIKSLSDVAASAGVTYVHPGYGFLSESADFAASIEAQGRIWVGPPPSVLRLFGDKTAARKLAMENDVPVVGGSENLGNAEEAEVFVSMNMTMPVIMKAAYGGGGRGMRIVRDLKDIRANFETCQREAKTAFGRGEVFVEEFWEDMKVGSLSCRVLVSRTSWSSEGRTQVGGIVLVSGGQGGLRGAVRGGHRFLSGEVFVEELEFWREDMMGSPSRVTHGVEKKNSPPAPRSPDHRRRFGRRAPPVRARLHGAASAPEGGGAGARTGYPSQAPRKIAGGGGKAGEGLPIPGRGHRRVHGQGQSHRSGDEVRVHGDESAVGSLTGGGG